MSRFELRRNYGLEGFVLARAAYWLCAATSREIEWMAIRIQAIATSNGHAFLGAAFRGLALRKPLANRRFPWIPMACRKAQAGFPRSEGLT